MKGLLLALKLRLACDPHAFHLGPSVMALLHCADAKDDIKRTHLQLQKSFTISGTLTPMGIHDYEATTLYPEDHHYTPIAKYMNDLIHDFKSQLSEE